MKQFFIAISTLILFSFTAASYAGRSFNGTNQALEAASVNLSGNSAVSLSFWLYVTSSWPAQFLFEFSTDMDSVTDGFYLRTDTTFLIAAHKGDVGYNRGDFSFASVDAWHHYVAVFDKNQVGTNAGEIDLYIDGTIASKTAVNSDNNTNDFGTYTFFMMESGAGDSWARDRLADVAVWNTRLTGTEISNLASGTLPSAIQTANLKGYWKICGVASPETDTSGQGHDATLVNSPTSTAHPSQITASCITVRRAQPIFFP